jgi:hypothetical protein
MGVDASSQGEADMAFEAGRGALAGARRAQNSVLQSKTSSRPWASIGARPLVEDVAADIVEKCG